MSDQFPQYAPRPRPAQLHPQYEPPKPPGRIRSNAHLIVAGGIAVLIGAIVGWVLYQDATATRAADATAVVQPTATPGPPVPQPVRTKPVEKSPPVGVAMLADGTYLVGKHIKPGTYSSPGADTGRCYWARLRDTSGEMRAVIAASYRTGRQIVTIRKGDRAFVTDGCGPWELMKP